VTRLKCDRNHPCENCRKRGLSETCTYVTSNRPIQSTLSQGLPPSPSIDVQDQGLQSGKAKATLVNNEQTESATSEVQGGEPLVFPENDVRGTVTPWTENPPHFPARVGRIYISSTETTYIDGSHWTVILDGVSLIFISLTIS
jgi:Fungal Zn(2)-Cys(6) binuclear cluster domain